MGNLYYTSELVIWYLWCDIKALREITVSIHSRVVIAAVKMAKRVPRRARDKYQNVYRVR